ncbi:TonB-dependent receptor [Flammeovirga sp. EKP202]|uniref:TonB-dependent receptor n=1 Tax=Flammeovirga sp. EKP202 TaxID=2770592 RepID=UPI00165F66B3|nr:TonB-dependent receptor [Flammeovirga sp. EKP202]MBD0401339.1 TonB-dependent receptor [Flammeovirga sp. EKP202]
MSKFRQITFILFSLLCTTFLYGQSKNYTLSGYIKDGATGESLIGATVYTAELKSGVVTNDYGFFSLTLPEGEYTVKSTYVGYNSFSKKIKLNENKKLNIELTGTKTELDEVLITGEREDANVTDVQMSTQKMDIETMLKIPALLGEVDVIKSIQLLPGVSSVGEGATGFNVRGGGIGQNLVLLDEAPVFNSSHLFGFFSVFNPDAVKDVKLIKGGIPAQYGGRISSILDVRMKDSSPEKLSINGGVGVIFSRLSVEAPIIKDKMSILVAGRRSYIDILAKPFLEEDLRSSKFNFWDLTAKVNYDLSEKNKIYLSAYWGRDNFGDAESFDSGWGNITSTFRWNHLFNDKLVLNTVAYLSNYDYNLNFRQNATDAFDWKSQIKTYSIKPEFTWYLGKNNTITMGAQSIYYDFSPGTTSAMSGGQELPPFELQNQFALENALYIGNDQKLSDKITLQYGLRWSSFTYLGPVTTYEYEEAAIPNTRRDPVENSERVYGDWEPVKTYFSLEPRLAIKYQLNEKSSIKASFTHMAQYIHLISNTSAASPLDVWSPSTNNIVPQRGEQYALGYFRNMKDNTFEFSTEVYYKPMRNLIDYINGADLLLNPYLEGDLLNSTGRAYGLEVYLRKKKGKYTGWLSYTLARSEQITEGINQSQYYPRRFDQAHNLTLSNFYELNDRWSFAANFSLISGTPTTFPTNQLQIQGYGIPHNVDDVRNNQRIPYYHRLDISATLKGKKKPNRRWEHYWIFGVYNTYARKNPYSIYFLPSDERPEQGKPAANEAIQFSVLANIIPSVSFNFKW